MSNLHDIKEAVISGDRVLVTRLTEQALNKGIESARIIDEGYIPAMTVVGERFASEEIYIPEMLIAARAMKTGLEVLKPHLVEGEIKHVAKVLLATVQGDRHDIGKNLVGIMLEGSGMKVIDLGVDIYPDEIVEAVRVHQPQFLGLSALLTTTMNSIEETVGAIGKAGLRDNVKILVGGAPVTQEFADQIGSDGYGKDAAAAVSRIKELMKA